MTVEPRSGIEPIRARPWRAAIERVGERAWRSRVGLTAIAFVAVALTVYVVSNPVRRNQYNHFVWQADAFVHGRFAIEWPVRAGPFVNYYFQDVLPLVSSPGFGLIPYPPLPAVLLAPFVALFGLRTDAALAAAVLGGLNVGLAWRIARRLTRFPSEAALATVFYGFGTVAWYAAAIGSTWFLAHVVAATFLLFAIDLAVASDLREAARVGQNAWMGLRVSGRQFITGLVFGLASLARLTTILGAPFFAFVGRGGTLGRGVAAGAGAAIPVLLLVAYNLASSGAAFHPAYEYAYRTEYFPRPELRNHEWAPEDPRYVPQNLAIMLGWPPVVRPECGLALADPACPLVQPDPMGMSLLLSSPGYLLIGALVGRRRRHRAAESAVGPALERRLAWGAALAIAFIAFADLAHFSQGWVQFGYRFSNDFAPFALVLVSLAIARMGVRPLSVTLVALSVLINAWGVYWGVTLGW